MSIDRSVIGRRSKRRGYQYEDWLEKNLGSFGFSDTKKQPLSGSMLNRPELTGDLAPTFYTADGHIYKFLVSAKRTSKTSIQFATDWVREITDLAIKIDRIPLVMFAMYGRPKLKNYIVIPEKYFISMTGNTDNILISNMKVRGKKYITIKKSYMEMEMHGNIYDRPVVLSFRGSDDEKNLLFYIDDFVKTI